MKKQITTLLLLITLSFSFAAKAQNCGQVIDFTHTETSNANGTKNYTFYVETRPVSGGTKSIQLTIGCSGTNFITNECYQAPAAGTVLTIGPFNNISTCSGTPTLTWTGYTNDKCGGNSCAGSTIALPVELLYIETSKVKIGVQIVWATASETNNQGFEIERSTDALNWTNIGWVTGNGNSNSVIEYSFLDKSPSNGANYYRLKQIDYDGNFEHTDVSRVIVKSQDRLKVYPNPTKGEVHFSTPVASFKVLDAYGTTLIESNETSKRVDLSDLKNGVYFMETTNELGNQIINKLFLTR